jgi:hypothetical protein
VAKQSKKVDRPASRAAPRAGTLEWNPDYGYVRADVRRIAYLAGAFISLLLILSFVVD